MSKKLEKNGLWESSRMILPEHKEAVIQRQLGKPTAPPPSPPSNEETKLMRDHIYLPILYTFVNKKIREMEQSVDSLKTLFIKTLQIIANHIREDLKKNNRLMMEKKIRVFEIEKAHDANHYGYDCRGYKDRFGINRETIRAEVSFRVKEYINGVITTMKV